MKKLHNLKIAATCLIIAVVVTMACNKTNETPVAESGDGDLTELLEKSKAMQKHVEAFKAKMEYYQDNPGIKSGGSIYSADSGAIELESLLNYNFCYTGIECNKKTFVTSEVTMPLDDLQKINDPKLMEVYYDKIIDTIQAQMGRVNYQNMKLLLVDLEVSGTDSNGDAVISVGALIGNESNLPIAGEAGWWFGNLYGNCEGNLPGVDASIFLTNDVMFAMFPAPPLGKIRKKTNITTLTNDHILPSDHWRKGSADRNNFKDSKVYTANHIYGSIGDNEKCLANYPDYDPNNEDCANEMTFYRHKYQEVIGLKETEYNNNNGTNYEIVEILVFNYEDVDNSQQPPQHLKTWHEIEISLGYVWFVNNTWVTKDILNYN